MTSMIDGKKTYAGLALVLLPMVARWLGVELTDEETQATAELVMQVAGWVLASIGAIHKDKKIAAEKARRYPMSALAGAALLTGLALGGSGIGCAHGQDVLIDHVKATTLELDAANGGNIKGFTPPFPQGQTAKLDAANHVSVIYAQRYVSKEGDDADSGESIFDPKLTIKSAVESLSAEGLSGTKVAGRIYVGPGIYEEDPIGVTTLPLGSGFQLIGSGTNNVFGTEIRAKSSYTSTDDMLTFHPTEDTHHVRLEGFVINMMGRGRDAIRMNNGGFNTSIRRVRFLNIPQDAIHCTGPMTALWLEDVAGAIIGYGTGTASEFVTFADVGGGAYHLASLDEPNWQANDVVRISTSGTAPAGLATHTDYYLVDDGGVLHLSATLGGAPLAATSAGTGTHRLYGGAAIPDLGTVTFADVGGGAYHLVNPLPRGWVAGDEVRLRSTGRIPGGLAGGTSYWLVDDGGNLRLSATLGGAPLAATSAGTGTVRLETAIDPDVHGSFLHIDNTGSGSTLSIVSITNTQIDAGGPYPIRVETGTGNPGVLSLTNVEMEVPYYGGTFTHDAAVGVTGTARLALTLDSVQLHTAGGGVGLQKAVVKQLDAGAPMVQVSSRNLIASGAQYDYLYSVADQTQLTDYEDAAIFLADAPQVMHAGDAADAVWKVGYGTRTTSGDPDGTPAFPTLQVLGSGALQMGTGQVAPTTRMSINSSGELTLDVASLPTADPGRSGALWRDVAGGNVLKISP